MKVAKSAYPLSVLFRLRDNMHSYICTDFEFLFFAKTCTAIVVLTFLDYMYTHMAYTKSSKSQSPKCAHT